MSTSRLLIALFLAASPVVVQGQNDSYWLIGQVVGRWEYREAGGRPRPLSGKYDCLLPAGEVRCLEADARNCQLRYLSSPRSKATTKLPIQATRQWISLRRLPAPPPAILPTTSAALARTFTRYTRPGGSRAGGSGCGGDFPMLAPACGENVDLSDFKIQWQSLADQPAGNLLVIVEPVDGRNMFRGTPVASSGEFATPGLSDFLRKLQNANETVDITVRITAGERRAVRLVHVPPSARTDEYESRVKEIDSPDPLVRAVSVMSLALEEGMWSRAGREASRLVDLAPGSPSLMEYALAGLCQSDFEDAKGRVRKGVSEDTYKRICSASPVAISPTPEAAFLPPSPPAAAAAANTPSVKTRPGIALLIGNSDYWTKPLNSVKSDLQNMKEALEGLGFAVSVRENLRNPPQFLEALDDTLKEQKATSDDILFVYYSGHGVQIDGRAYLLGTGVSEKAQVVEDTRSNAQSAEGLLAEMERALPATRVLVVEACRDAFSSASRSTDSRTAKGGFAFRQDDVPNTFVMFANKPGLPTPVRSDTGIGGPFTESLVYALSASTTGEIQDVYRLAAEKTREMSPGQEPDEHHSRSVESVILRPRDQAVQDKRAKALLNDAEPLYRDRAWDDFLAAVTRGKALSTDPELHQRLSREVDFASLVKAAEDSERDRKWSDAAEKWQRASEVFPVRQWATMKAAVAWLLADDLTRAVRLLAVVTAQSEGDAALQAKRVLADLVKAFPALEAEAGKAAQGTAKISGVEFERIKHEE